MKRHLIDSHTGEIIDISRLRPATSTRKHRRSQKSIMLDLKLAGALTLLVAAMYAL